MKTTKKDICSLILCVLLVYAVIVWHHFMLSVNPLIELIPKIKSGVVYVRCPQWQSSGFVIGPNLIMTARHCLENIEEFEITTNDGHKLYATRAISSDKHDIGFIYVDDLTCTRQMFGKGTCEDRSHTVELQSLKLGSITECQLGETVVTIGSPFGKVNFNSVTKGIISGLDRDYDPLNNTPYGYHDYGWSVAFQTDSPGHPGNSGCPIFTVDGVVRGILVGGFDSSLVICMPIDLVLNDIALVEDMFRQDAYHRERVTDVAAKAWGY